MSDLPIKKVAVIGGGPAGLMACDEILKAGFEVHLFEKMPSLGRKFLMAGKSGLNITHSEPLEKFINRYPDVTDTFKDIVRDFGPDEICQWVKSLGIETYVGSSGRIFPTDSKAAPLLRTWIKQMKARGLQVHVRHSWKGWDENGGIQFETSNEEVSEKFDAYVYAMGGASWARLGSDGEWVGPFKNANQSVLSFRPRNGGFQIKWSAFMEKHFGHPVKTVGLKVGEEKTKGDFIITPYGVEGSAIYTMSRPLDIELQKSGKVEFFLDLMPDRTCEKLLGVLQKPRGKKSLSNFLKNQIGISETKLALLYEVCPKDELNYPEKLVHHIKNLRLQIHDTQPLDEAISTAGGLGFKNLDENLMLKEMPGHFVAGEMLDWEAPTGGYLLTACFATGSRAGRGVVNYLNQ